MASEKNVVRVLWADDDTEGALLPLELRLSKAYLRVEQAADYERAIEILEEGKKGDVQVIDSLLLDVILPRRKNKGALDSYTGLTLARVAAQEFKIKRICFLTVVLKGNVRDEYEALARELSDVKIGYYDKSQLLETHVISGLVQFLRGEDGNLDDTKGSR